MILNFRVDRDRIVKITPDILASGSRLHWWCDFDFSPDWDDYEKTVAFWTDQDTQKYLAVVIDNRCVIPASVLAGGRHFVFMTIVGENDEHRHTTAIHAIPIYDSGLAAGEEIEPAILEITVDSAGTITEDTTDYDGVQITVPAGSVSMPLAPSISPTASVLSRSRGHLTVQLRGSKTVTPTLQEGWVSSVPSVTVNVANTRTINLELQSKTATITPSTEAQSVELTPDSNKDGLMSAIVTVEAIPEGYVIPSGTKNIVGTGTFNVAGYEYVQVVASAPIGGGGNIQY